MKKHSLQFIDNKSKYFCEALGIPFPTYEAVFKSMRDFFMQQNPEDTVSSMLEAYLASPGFASLHFTLDNPNKYFLLGHIVAIITNNETKSKLLRHAFMHITEAGLQPILGANMKAKRAD